MDRQISEAEGFQAKARFPREIPDDSQCLVSFNVMPGREVSETLTMKKYTVGEGWIEAEFDRAYQSAMLNSPSHLTFIAACIQMQKIIYVYCCSQFGLSTDVHGPEQLKVWPTSIHISMPKMVIEEAGIRHRIEFTEFRKIDHQKYFCAVKSKISGLVTIDSSGIISLIEEPRREAVLIEKQPQPTNQPTNQSEG